MPLRKGNIQSRLQPFREHDNVWCLRTRLTIAEVNANTILLPAIPNSKYRIVDVSMIAIGGVTATQPVRLTAVQGGATVDLVNNAVANLTQNTLLRAGATGSTILAGGLSFVSNDKNTAIRANSAGVTGATHIDFIVLYVIESDSLLSGPS